jgi:cytochrome c peroxidase
MKMFGKVFLAFTMVLLLGVYIGVLDAAANGPSLTPEEQLGKLLFFDENLSTPPGQSCATCHAPEVGFTGPDSDTNLTTVVYPGAVHTRFGNRKPPTAAYGGESPVLYFDEGEGLWIGGMFWDGRATGWTLGDPLAEQAQGPFLNPLEQNNPNALYVCLKVADSDYASLFEQVWGPGSLAPLFIKKNLELTYERIALSISDYEQSAEVNPFTSKYDAYLAGPVTLTDQEALGLELFEGKAMCSACHISEPGTGGEPPLFTDFTYDNIGVPRNLSNPFYSMPRKWNPDGEDWIDPGLGGFLKGAGYGPDVYEPEWGKHKVPTLRNVDMRPDAGFVKAYGHNGFFKSLEEITHFYNTRDVEEWPGPEVPVNVNTSELGNLGLSADEEAAIVAFMKTLTDGYVLPTAAPPVHPVVRVHYMDREPPEFQLFQNTPNPFNPETWIPFALGKPEDVSVSIYDVQGRLVKTMSLGTKPAGVYTGRDKAVYWDGTNANGERVASGIYYYVMQAGPFRKARKMVILE